MPVKNNATQTEVIYSESDVGIFSGITIGVVVHTWQVGYIIREIDKLGVKSVSRINPEQFTNLEFWEESVFPDILVLDAAFIRKNSLELPPEKNVSRKKKILKIPHMNFQYGKKLPAVLVFGEKTIYSYAVVDESGKEHFLETVCMVSNSIERIVSIVEYLAIHRARVKESFIEIMETQKELVARIARGIEARDDSTGYHVRRIQGYVRVLAEGCPQIPKEEIPLLELTAALHDLGKLAIPDDILKKPGLLTDPERETMQTHSRIGAEILACREDEYQTDGRRMPLLEKSCSVAYSHHERWDGQGYPRKLSGDNIPLWGRLVAIVDSFDAMTGRRPYQPKGKSFDEAFSEIIKCSGKQYDPELVEVFISVKDTLQSLYDNFKREEQQEEKTQLPNCT